MEERLFIIQFYFKKKQWGISLIQSITACERRVEEVGTTRNSPKHTNSVNIFKITLP
jgi:hypothetical protein